MVTSKVFYWTKWVVFNQRPRITFNERGICSVSQQAERKKAINWDEREEEGVALVRKYDGEFPEKHFKEFLEYTDTTEEHFWEVIDSFRLPHLWKKVKGEWKLKHQVP